MTPTAGIPAFIPVDLPPEIPAADDIFDTLFGLPAGVALVDRLGSVRETNDRFAAMAGDGAITAIAPWLGDLWSGVLRRVDIEVQIPCLDHDRWSHMQAALADIDGERLAVVVITPIGARPGADSDDFFAQFVDLTTDWVWQCDSGARYTYASGRIHDFLGFDPRELIGKTACDFVDPSDANRAAAVLLDLIHNPRSFAHVPLLARHRCGSVVALEVSGIPLIDADGTFHGYRGVVRDVSEREAQKRALQRLAAAMDHAGDMVLITDPGGRIEYANPAFERLSGYRADEVIGKHPDILRSGQHPPEFYDDLRHDLDAGRMWSGHFVNRRRDGTLFHTDSTISPIFDAGGAITGYVGVHRDVTEELALIDRLHTAAQMERFGKLVSGVAHEVRNPLNAIQAATAALELDSGNDPETRPLFQIVRSQVERLAQLMRDLLIIAKPVHEHWLHRRRIGDVVAEAIASWQRDPRTRVSLAVDFDGEVWLDSGRLHQVLVNLLDNAVQHSGAEPEVAVTVQYDGQACRIAVRDAGRGIDAAALAHVFEPFFTTRRGGTGLGLSLVKSIVEQHGGSVSLRLNEPEPGCTAEVVLPVAK